MAAAVAAPMATMRFTGGEAAPAPPQQSREQILAMIVKLLRVKGPPAVAQLQQKVNLGQGLTVKGMQVDTGLLKEALAAVAEKAPTASVPPAPAAAAGQHGNSAVPGYPATAGTSAQQPASAAASAATTAAPTPSARWAVSAPSAAALAQKALQECETAEPFVCKVKNIGENQLAVLAKPNVQSVGMAEHIAPGETFDVIARCHRVQDGRTYLRLRKSEGWVSTRSHRDLWKIVLARADGGAAVEPNGSPTVFQSRAVQVLSRVDDQGRRVDGDGQPLQQGVAALVSQEQPRQFRVAGGRGQSILGHPSASASTTAALSGILQARDEFLADAVCIVQAEGRAYLRLQDGRGWISERSKTNFSIYAVEPAGFRVHGDEYEQPAVPRKLIGGHAKTFVIERQAPDMSGAEVDQAVAAEASKPAARSTPLKDEAVVLRSDVELWPKALGAARPIKGDMRVALRRHSRLFFRKVKECTEDLKEFEKHIAGFARACDGKKALEQQADVLRKEIAKVEQEWKAAIEKDIAGLSASPAPKPASDARGGTVAPVQVLGEAWHCAVVRSDQYDAEGGKFVVQHFGPLRPNNAVASEDLQRLAEAVAKRVSSGVEEVSPPAKKRRTKEDSALKEEVSTAQNAD